MPRPKKEGAPEPKRRSRYGCWPCKSRKIKCGEEKPACINCHRQGEACDYSVRLNWEGRVKQNQSNCSSAPSAGRSNAQASFVPSTLGLWSSTPIHARHDFNFTGEFPVSAAQAASACHTPIVTGRHEGTIKVGTTAEHSSPKFFVSRSNSQVWYEIDDSNPGLIHLHGPDEEIPHKRPSVDFAPPGPGKRTPWGSTGSDRATQDAGRSRPSPLTIQELNAVPSAAPSSLPQFFRGGSRPPSELTSLSSTESCPSQQLPDSKVVHDVSNPSASRASSISDSRRSSRAVGRGKVPSTQTSGTPTLTHQLSPSTSVFASQGATGAGKLSINALLATPSLHILLPDLSVSQEASSVALPSGVDINNSTSTYGWDQGHADLDIPNNDDRSAVRSVDILADKPTPQHAETSASAFGKGGYYANAVPIKIPKALEPLPRMLDNPMNLLYFHHFLNHTASILVPHECTKNPFRSILPMMALKNINLLNLLLAYSASHRARLLQHPEPNNRIALWARELFPRLRHALSDPGAKFDDANLASAIMLASLEIMSPKTFEIQVPWQDHLHMARKMIEARGGPQAFRKHDQVAFFLIRWFAYLDVLGSLIRSSLDPPLLELECETYWNENNEVHKADREQLYPIDCMLGFSSRCVYLMARIAQFAKQADHGRLTENGMVRPEWEPSPYLRQVASQLHLDLEEARLRSFPCFNVLDSECRSHTERQWATRELMALNDAFHWAAHIHLYRRLLGKAATSPEICHAVRQIVFVLSRVRRGGIAEATLIFPLFTAGCETLDHEEREIITVRIKGLEAYGMTQARKALNHLQQIWNSGLPWESVVKGEFFG